MRQLLENPSPVVIESLVNKVLIDLMVVTSVILMEWSDEPVATWVVLNHESELMAEPEWLGSSAIRGTCFVLALFFFFLLVAI